MTHMRPNALGPIALPWSGVSQRWGHPWHPMCSYLGTFPPALARSLIVMLSDPSDVVLDPFAGRGTTLLEARASGRLPLASDLNPIAVALARAKNTLVDFDAVTTRVRGLEERYDARLYLPEAHVESDEIQLIYDPRTLAQLCYLRRALVPAKDEVDTLLVGAVLGVMHGAERKDGSSSYASISMPNTFSMSPDYVRRFVAKNRLQRVERNMFNLLQQKVERLFRGFSPLGPSGVVARGDAKEVASLPPFSPYLGRVRLVVTSPPYLDVVNYAKQNWIRCWFLNEQNGLLAELDDNLTLQSWLDFMSKSLEQMKRFLSDDGTIVLVIGDVAKSSRSVVSLAREFVRRVRFDDTFSYVGCLTDRLQTENKTTRIWGETKGNATAVDRIIFLSRSRPTFRIERLSHDLFGAGSMLAPDLSASMLEEFATQLAG